MSYILVKAPYINNTNTTIKVYRGIKGIWFSYPQEKNHKKKKKTAAPVEAPRHMPTPPYGWVSRVGEFWLGDLELEIELGRFFCDWSPSPFSRLRFFTCACALYMTFHSVWGLSKNIPSQKPRYFTLDLSFLLSNRQCTLTQGMPFCFPLQLISVLLIIFVVLLSEPALSCSALQSSINASSQSDHCLRKWT